MTGIDTVLYCISGDDPVKLGSEKVKISNIKKVGNYIWMTRMYLHKEKKFSHYHTDIWQMKENSLSSVHKISIPAAEDPKIKEVGGQTWIIGNSFCGRIVEDKVIPIIEEKDIFITKMQEFNGQVWLHSNKGTWRVKDDSVIRILDQNLHSSSNPNIMKMGNHTWIKTDEGLWRVEGNAAVRKIDVNDGNFSIKSIGNETWVFSHAERERSRFNDALNVNGAWRIRGNSVQRIPDQDLDVGIIRKIGDDTWIGGDKGAWRIRGNSAQRIPDQDLDVDTIQEIGDYTWIGGDKGAWRIKGNSIQQLTEKNTTHFVIISDQVWAQTGKGGLRVDGDIAAGGIYIDVPINQVENLGEHSWLFYGDTYKFHKNTRIVVDFATKASWWRTLLRIFLPGEVWIGRTFSPKPRYVDDSSGTDPFAKEFPRNFKIIVETDPEKFQQKVAKRRYSALEDSEKNISPGSYTVYVKVLDHWGRTYELPPRKVWVIPGPLSVIVLIPLLGIGLLLIILFLAPFSTFCHDLVMNPFLRKYGSFGVVPLLITAFPRIRRYLLRRYIDNLQKDNDFSMWLDRFVLPGENFHPSSFGKLLKEKRKLLYLGKSGVGKTSYFKYLVAYFAAGNRPDVLKGIQPVFLPLSRYADKPPEEVFDSQLKSYGRIIDEKLGRWFLKQGGFIIFMDGLNEVSKETRDQVNRFVDQYKNANYICLNAQEEDSNLSWIEPINILPLNPGKINEVLALRLGEKWAADVIETFDETAYKLCEIPHNLDLVIQLLKEKENLPKTETELYAKIIDGIFARWKEEGKGEYENLLYQRAFEMIRTGDLVFNSTGYNIHIPGEMTDRLSEKKSRMLVKRDNHYYFRHDLIRAFLASRYVGPRWREFLLDNEMYVDFNWRAMLEFVIISQGSSEEIKELLFAILEKNKILARTLFEWLGIHYPALCKSWLREFKIKSW
ncbi:MAG: hypothetical protein GY950_23545 [bacterium]|nr:hypothetical protein [bacterium]